MKPTPQHLFVYGTLRREHGQDMYRLLARHADFVGHASYRGRLFLVDDFPGATPSTDPDAIVRGEVYRLEAPEVVLRQLDEYEEVDARDPDSSLYRRELADVQLDDGRVFRAWIYLYNRSTNGLTVLPSGDFLALERR
jgi:gamma-glutamylcyclotransferase (GGCT)/AIG2-like uncharacterized protein YtfP